MNFLNFLPDKCGMSYRCVGNVPLTKTGGDGLNSGMNKANIGSSN